MSHRIRPKSHLLADKGIDTPWSTRGLFTEKQPAHLLCSASEVVMVQPANNGYLVDLAIDLNISRFR